MQVQTYRPKLIDSVPSTPYTQNGALDDVIERADLHSVNACDRCLNVRQVPALAAGAFVTLFSVRRMFTVVAVRQYWTQDFFVSLKFTFPLSSCFIMN